MDDPERRLVASWRANARAWTRSVREGRIESRRVATDRAILDAVRGLGARRLLDVGCGEGWLARELAQEGVTVVGFDGSRELVVRADQAGGGRFHHLTYAGFAENPSRLGDGFDAVVCNFSLLSEDIGPVLRACRAVLAPHGALLVQTVHPVLGGSEPPYQDGWREERFDALGEGFRSAMPWFFRTLATWIRELREAGLQLHECREPLSPTTGVPLSLLLVASPGPDPGGEPC
jgi:2-polyprenyl-3-methyl-5-hydroxy-6-metoxy-1,4-benzoquinol methylase